MKKSIFAGLALALTLTAAPVALGDDSQETKQIQVPQSGGWIGIDFIDTSYDGTSLITVVNDRTDQNYDSWKTVICDSASDAKCQLPGYMFDVKSMFSPCTATITENCIESIKATLPSGEVLSGVPGKLWNPNGVFKGDSLLGIPDGGQPSTWTIKGSNPNGSEDYVLIAGVQGMMRVPEMHIAQGTDNYFWGNLFAYFQPVKYTYGNYQDPKMVLFPRGKTGVGTGGGLAINQGCFMNDTKECAIRSAFPLDVKYSIKFRFNVRLNSWLRGRLVEPTITTENSGEPKSTMTISAKPMVVPDAGGYIKWSDAPDWVKAKYPSGTGGVGGTFDAFTTTNLDTRILRTGAGTSGWRALKEFKEWIPFLQDKPYAMKTYWNLQSVEFDPKSNKMAECARMKFAGLVASNASVYSSGAPEWNDEKQSLDYTVGAPHYDLDGNIFKGQYYLALKSDVARCLYGFSNAPISAKIEVASEDGNPEIATTVVNEDRESGFMTLTASGFHYSTPVISAKFTQEKETVIAPPVAQQPIKKTITCVKGKVKKRITSTNPTCPKGYRKS